MTTARPALSVVVATYNRGDAVERLLRQLADQSLPADAYEVVVVDDGSAEPAEPRLRRLPTPYQLRVITQANGGPAVARHAGVQAAAGEIIVIVDDDMQVARDFLEAHLRAHPAGSRNVVLGRIALDTSVRMPLFERYQAAMLDRLFAGVRGGTVELRGGDLYTGNVSLRRADYVAVGGFDPALRLSEDAELGLRLERAGATFVLSDAASALHSSDHARLGTWLRRAFAYGVSDSGIADKHAEHAPASPWRFLFAVNPVSRPILLASAVAPGAARSLAWLAMRAALGAARLGAERAAIAGTTLVYGVQYFRGVREHAGSRRQLVDGLLRYLRQRPEQGLGRVALLAKLAADLRADHAAVLHADAKYKGKISRRPRMTGDLVQRVGLQMMLAYRVMRYFRAARFPLLARVASRLIRHLYGADIHWDAELAPGVMIVHGIGLVVSHAARVGPGCVLFHHVTLGENIHPETRQVGSPTLEANVHVGPGATLLGPITVGQGTKITAGALLAQSVAPQSLVESPAPTISVRQRPAAARVAKMLALAALLAAPGACTEAGGTPGRAAGTRSAAAPAAAEPIYDGGLAAGWQAAGAARQELAPGAAARVDLGGEHAWALTKPGLTGSFGALVFRYAAPAGFGDALEVRLDSPREDVFPRVAVQARHRRDLAGGFTEVVVGMGELNPSGAPFDRIVWRVRRRSGEAWVRLDKIRLAALDGTPATTTVAGAGGWQDAPMTVDCAAPAHPINPLIYGIAYDPRLDAQDTHVWQLGATARRWGGNPASRYNWELGNAWNTAQDWFYRNVNYTGSSRFSYDTFLDANLERGVGTALTVPILGHVARDTVSYAFPVSEHGAQRNHDPYLPDAGDGVGVDGTPLRPGHPARTSVPAPPEMIGRWVSAIVAKDARRGRSVGMYILDNEPALWNSTHRDVHPEPTTYDELLERTIAYGTAVRRADPGAVIAGPAEWGWPAYLFSAADAAAGFRLKPDRRRHGDVPLLPWYLRQLREHERKTGVRVLDVVDLHFYPQANGVFGPDGGTDSATAALRIRSTRALWDPTYRDESWIADTVRLIPRLREWIAAEYPGLGVSIGEWNFGAERHISGGLAVAEALGRFGQAGITSAFYWTYPPDGSPAFHAFRAFRNYDGGGRTFRNWSLATRAAAGTSLFASRDDRGTTVVAVVLNLSPARPALARVDHGSCGAATARRHFAYAARDSALSPVSVAATGTAFQAVLAPYSINVFEISLAPSPRAPDAPVTAR